MEKYVEDWFFVIKNCSVENTYKMGWILYTTILDNVKPIFYIFFH